MRCLTRNKTAFYFAPYIGETDITDEYGNLTGEHKITYGNPVRMHGNVSAAQGEIQSRQFGESERYDKVIVLDDMNVMFGEHSILWVDTLPHLNEDGSTNTPHDYIVRKIARGLNGVSIAISKVVVT